MGVKQLIGAGEEARAPVEKDNGLFGARCADLDVKAPALAQINFT